MTTLSLNSAQQEIIQYSKGPMMVLAGAGSGKTRTLIEKIHYLIEVCGLSSNEILGVTFSNKASKEMRHRLLYGKLAHENFFIYTFHGLASRILRSHASFLGLTQNFSLYTESESKTIAKSLLEKNGYNLKETTPSELLHYVEQLKNLGIWGQFDWNNKEYLHKFYTEDDREQLILLKKNPFYGLFEQYELELAKVNACDFGSLITYTLKLFLYFPQILLFYQNQFRYVLVDEYQDTNKAQFILMAQIAEQLKNICIVGDEDQCIYSWRGAHFSNFEQFKIFFETTKTFFLEQNYRSSQNIIEAASAVIGNNEYRHHKNLWTLNTQGELIDIQEHFSEQDEAKSVVKQILQWQKEDIPFSQMAIFYRNNYQSRPIEDELRLRKIPYRIVGGLKFYDRMEIKDLLAYFHLINNPKDSVALTRIINVPRRGIGTTSLKKIEFLSQEHQLSFWEIIHDLVRYPQNYPELKLSKKVINQLEGFVALIQTCQNYLKQGISIIKIFDLLIFELDYFSFLKNFKIYEFKAREENIKEFRRSLELVVEDNPQISLSQYLQNITLDQTITSLEEENNNQGELNLMTVHSAKGLEFPYVILVGVEDNIFPSYRALDDEGPKGLEEERRLFYVAMTRAMKKLILSYVRQRYAGGEKKFNLPSRFLAELPKSKIYWKKLTSQELKQAYQYSFEGGRFDSW